MIYTVIGMIIYLITLIWAYCYVKDDNYWRGAAIPMMFLYITIGVCGRADGKNLERQNAIKAGVAEWIIDSKTGKKEFKYLTPNKGNEPTKNN
jgi:hypothetical protein